MHSSSLCPPTHLNQSFKHFPTFIDYQCLSNTSSPLLWGCWNQLNYWKWIVTCFKLVSGLDKFAKKWIIPIGGMEDVDRAIVLFGCKVRRFPTSYLGLPLGAPHRSIGVWNVIEERFKRKLPTWKKQYLSKGGRLVLIKSTLSSLPIYFMSNVGQP